MIIDMINKKLKQKLEKEKHELLKLQWKKAELERIIEQAKKNNMK